MFTPVNFKISKLLKEEGFDENCEQGYNGAFEPFHIGLVDFSFPQKNSELFESAYTAPIIARVLMYLYNKYGIWITPWMASERSWGFHILKTSDGYVLARNTRLSNSPTEAYEEAIAHYLENFINKKKQEA